MGKYGVTFASGRTVEIEAADGDDAKRRARAAARREEGEDTPRSDPNVKIARVERLDR